MCSVMELLGLLVIRFVYAFVFRVSVILEILSAFFFFVLKIRYRAMLRAGRMKDLLVHVHGLIV